MFTRIVHTVDISVHAVHVSVHTEAQSEVHTSRHEGSFQWIQGLQTNKRAHKSKCFHSGYCLSSNNTHTQSHTYSLSHIKSHINTTDNIYLSNL